MDKKAAWHLEGAIVDFQEARAIQLYKTDPKYGDINRPWRNGGHSFPEACGRGMDRLVAMMLARHVSPETTGVDQQTGLFRAAKWGREAATEVLLENKANPNRIQKSAGFECIALHSAAVNNHLPVVNMLLAHGANPDLAKTQDGWTALMHACSRGYTEIAHRLIAVSDLGLVDKEGHSARDLAAERNHEPIVSAIDSALARKQVMDLIHAIENESKLPSPSL